jgi:hypothetical protein
MWWHKHIDPEKPLRVQLMDARRTLINQIAIMDVGPSRGGYGGSARFQAQADELRTVLGEIEAQLAEAPDPAHG